MEIGMSPSQIRTIVYSLSGIFGIAAIFLTSLGKIILLVLISIIAIFLTEILDRFQKK